MGDGIIVTKGRGIRWIPRLSRQDVKNSPKASVIFIWHRLSATRMAEHIYMMEQGRIIEEGNHRELLDKGGRYAEMFKKQAEKYQEKNF